MSGLEGDPERDPISAEEQPERGRRKFTRSAAFPILLVIGAAFIASRFTPVGSPDTSTSESEQPATPSCEEYAADRPTFTPIDEQTKIKLGDTVCLLSGVKYLARPSETE